MLHRMRLQTHPGATELIDHTRTSLPPERQCATVDEPGLGQMPL